MPTLIKPVIKYTRVNFLEFAEIASTGNTQDFGDLVDDPSDRDGTSNGHGGL